MLAFVTFTATVLLSTVKANLTTGPSPDYRKISDEIHDKCPNVDAESYSPSCVLGVTGRCNSDPQLCSMTGVEIGLWLDHFKEINDVLETFEFSGSLSLYWNTRCSNYRLSDQDVQLNADDRFWKPHVYHKNAEIDYSMSGMAKRFYIQGIADSDHYYSLRFFLQFSGVFSTSSALDYAMFPFDTQIIEVEFLVRDIACAVSFTKLTEPDIDPATFISSGVGWTYLGTNHTYGYRRVAGQNRSVATYEIVLKRRPEFYIWNLMIPSVILTSVELITLAMPVHLPDRPVMCMTVLLANCFLQSQILDHVPIKPQRMFLTNYTDFCGIFSWAITAYTLIMCGAADAPKWRKWFERRADLKMCYLSRARIFDLVIFSLAIASFIAVGFYAITVALTA